MSDKKITSGCPECGHAMEIICPCGKKSGEFILEEKDMFELIPDGWSTVVLEEGFPPYKVCSDECKKELLKYVSNLDNDRR